MEISKYLQDDIVKIQNELITAIQNHQVLVLRQGVDPSDNVRTQIEEVQRHIICLGESQKILVSRLKTELESPSLREKNKNNESSTQLFPNKPNDSKKCNIKNKTNELGRSLLIKHIVNNKDNSLKTANPSDSDNFSERKSLISKERPSVDSSSEENRTPCASPANVNSDWETRGLKRPQTESHAPTKRAKTTLQATPRPSSPVSAANDTLSSSSEESLDSLHYQRPEVDRKIEFAHSLGLITQDVYKKVINKKSERRKRRISHQHHLYNGLWDLTVFQRRSRVKEDDLDDINGDYNSPHSDTDSLCFVCRKPGELEECRVCQTGCHVTCVVANVCPACTHQACPVITEKKKELEQLKLKNKELHKSVAKLRERAKVLSASLVTQTATVNQLSAKEDKLHESIKNIKDFIAYFQGSSPTS